MFDILFAIFISETAFQDMPSAFCPKKKVEYLKLASTMYNRWGVTVKEQFQFLKNHIKSSYSIIRSQFEMILLHSKTMATSMYIV